METMLIDSIQAARELCISPRTLWSLTKAGDIPPVRIGSRVLYKPDDLRAFIDARRNPQDVERN